MTAQHRGGGHPPGGGVVSPAERRWAEVGVCVCVSRYADVTALRHKITNHVMPLYSVREAYCIYSVREAYCIYSVRAYCIYSVRGSLLSLQ